MSYNIVRHFQVAWHQQSPGDGNRRGPPEQVLRRGLHRRFQNLGSGSAPRARPARALRRFAGKAQDTGMRASTLSELARRGVPDLPGSPSYCGHAPWGYDSRRRLVPGLVLLRSIPAFREHSLATGKAEPNRSSLYPFS
jgi:hypothetical protein